MRFPAHFGHWLQVPRRGRTMHQWQVAAGLIYGQVKKIYRRRQLIRVTPVMRLGTEDALKAALQGLGFSGRLNTAFIERVNLTVRHGVAALARRTWATAKPSPQLLAHLEWWRAYYHGCRDRTPRCALRCFPHEREGGSFWHNAPVSVPQPWQRKEPPDGGPRGKCSLPLCHRCHTSHDEREGSEEAPHGIGRRQHDQAKSRHEREGREDEASIWSVD